MNCELIGTQKEARMGEEGGEDTTIHAQNGQYCMQRLVERGLALRKAPITLR